MDEGLMNLLDDDSSRDIPQHGHGEADDHLATSRLQAHLVPPAPGSRPQGPPQVLVPPPRQSYPTGSASPGGMLYPSEAPKALPRTSWWRALIASSLAPSASEDMAGRRMGTFSIGTALVFALTALVIGLRGSPEAPSSGVAVALVVARGALALGLLAFSYALLRMGERLLSGSDRKPGA
jgi:hypothetical protein